MTETIPIRIVRLRPESDADIPLPQYMTLQAAGMDVCAAVRQELIVEPGAIALIPTGFSIAIPDGFEVQVRPRSGLAIAHGIGLINSPGTIDADYRGEVMIAVINHGRKEYSVHRGDRIAQLVVNRVFKAALRVVATLDPTDRNTGGFGHTGIK